MRGVPATYAQYRKNNPPAYGSGTGPMRILGGERVVHVLDLMQEDAYRIGEPNRRALVDLGGARTSLLVPLSRDDALLGSIQIYRQEVRPFSDKQIALLQNFAAQAVIAMDNARLITETREALEQQTATAEVLGVINSSPGDLTPVFDILVATAARLCNSDMAHLFTQEDEGYRAVASFAHSPEFDSFIRRRLFTPGRGTVAGRTVLEGRVVHIADLGADTEFSLPESVRIGKIRTVLGVPLLRGGQAIGVITLSRQRIEAFTERQIELVQTFAAQAVIAIENARLITETREALEQQTATAEVLGVINSSPGDLTPVFDAILEKAHTLCGGTHGALGTYDGDFYFRSVAARGYPEPLAERLQEGFDGLTNPVTRQLIDGARFVHIPDLAEIDHPIPQAVASLGGFHTGLFLPLARIAG
jgi:GAF domain-containing protein